MVTDRHGHTVSPLSQGLPFEQRVQLAQKMASGTPSLDFDDVLKRVQDLEAQHPHDDAWDADSNHVRVDYVVDPNGSGTHLRIQDAIQTALAAGNLGDHVPVIWLAPGSYSENLTFTDNFRNQVEIWAAGYWEGSPGTTYGTSDQYIQSATISGSITTSGSCVIIFRGVRFSLGTSNIDLIDGLGNVSQVTFVDCSIEGDATVFPSNTAASTVVRFVRSKAEALTIFHASANPECYLFDSELNSTTCWSGASGRDGAFYIYNSSVIGGIIAANSATSQLTLAAHDSEIDIIQYGFDLGSSSIQTCRLFDNLIGSARVANADAIIIGNDFTATAARGLYLIGESVTSTFMVSGNRFLGTNSTAGLELTGTFDSDSVIGPNYYGPGCAINYTGVTDPVNYEQNFIGFQYGAGPTSLDPSLTNDRIRFIDTSTVVWTSPAAGQIQADIAGGVVVPAAHNLLASATHGDTVTQTVSQGSLIYGNSTPAWDELVVGAAGSGLWTDGTDASWTTSPRFAGYLRVGSASAPTNTTAGDITGERLILPDQAVATNNRIRTTRTFTPSGASFLGGTLVAIEATATLGPGPGIPSALYATNTLQPTASGATVTYAMVGFLIHNAGAFIVPEMTATRYLAQESVAGGTATLLRAGFYEYRATAGTITTAVGLDVARGGSSDIGSIVTGIGLRISASTGVTPTTDIAIQSLGGQHRLVGDVKIGANSTPGIALDVTGSSWISTYLHVGSLAAPTNTTAGDITGIRFSLDNTAFAATGRFVRLAGSITATSGTEVAYLANPTLEPGAASSAAYRSLYFANIIPATEDNNFTGQIAGIYTEGARARGSGNLTNTTFGGVAGIKAFGVVFDSSADDAGTVTLATGVVGLGWGLPSGTFNTKTITTAVGLSAPNPDAWSGSATPGTYVGLDIASLTRASVNIGIRNASNTLLGTYLRVGAVAAGNNVTTGDISSIRLYVGTDAAILSGLSAQVAGHLGISNENELRLYDSGSSNYIAHRSNASRTANLTYVWPVTDPTASQVLSASAPVAGIVTLSWATGGGGGAPHAILDGGTAHTDAAADAVTKGSLIVGNTTPAWDELNVGANSAVLEADSTQSLGVKWTVAVRSIILTAGGAMRNTTSGAGRTQREAATNLQNYITLDYDDTTAEKATWVVSLPDNYDGGTITAIVYWRPATHAAGGTTVWGIRGRSYGDNEAIDQAFGTEVTVSDDSIVTGNVHITAASSAITLGGTPAGGELAIIEVRRAVADAADDLVGDAYLIGVKLEYTTNSYSD